MNRFLKSLGYAWQGIRYSIAKEQNFKIQVVAAFIAIVLCILLKCSSVEWMIILICIAAVLSLEMMNTVLEKICNLLQTTFNPEIKIIKDVAAAAVLLTSIAAAICGTIIFLPKIIHLF